MEDSTEPLARRLSADLQRAWSLALPYWRGPERWRARAMLAGLIGLNLVLVGTILLFTYWQGAFYNALEAKDWQGLFLVRYYGGQTRRRADSLWASLQASQFLCSRPLMNSTCAKRSRFGGAAG